jgi:hypothetical protein
MNNPLLIFLLSLSRSSGRYLGTPSYRYAQWSNKKFGARIFNAVLEYSRAGAKLLKFVQNAICG